METQPLVKYVAFPDFRGGEVVRRISRVRASGCVVTIEGAGVKRRPAPTSLGISSSRSRRRIRVQGEAGDQATLRAVEVNTARVDLGEWCCGRALSFTCAVRAETRDHIRN